MYLLANMLSTIKNSSLAGKSAVEVPYSKQCESVCKLLENLGYLTNVKVFKVADKAYKGIHADLVYTNNAAKIMQAQCISKPGRRIYKSYQDLESLSPDFGVLLVSTSRGIMSSVDAKKKRLGGEVLCKVY